MTDDAPAVSCNRCVYWQSLDDREGECRRQPPVVDFVDGAPESAWPATNATDWCGEFNGDEIAGRPDARGASGTATES
jgi:hypothetical protein